MADLALRTAARAQDRPALLRARLRSGELTDERLRWAARLGDVAAQEVLGEVVDQIDWSSWSARRAAIVRVGKAVGGARKWRPTAVLFVADCAERVLHLHERLYPDDRAPREAIERAREWARASASGKRAKRGEAVQARERAREAWRRAWDARNRAWQRYRAAAAAADAAAADAAAVAAVAADAAADAAAADAAAVAVAADAAAEAAAVAADAAAEAEAAAADAAAVAAEAEAAAPARRAELLAELRKPYWQRWATVRSQAAESERAWQRQRLAAYALGEAS